MKSQVSVPNDFSYKDLAHFKFTLISFMNVERCFKNTNTFPPIIVVYSILTSYML